MLTRRFRVTYDVHDPELVKGLEYIDVPEELIREFIFLSRIEQDNADGLLDDYFCHHSISDWITYQTGYLVYHIEEAQDEPKERQIKTRNLSFSNGRTRR